ncbi:MAG TPA: GNAT family N-acetyltransferase [Rhizobacter sp.]|jgi:GNAT superfamily N-acetyltransferase|nr:GNAT family N-acetyltransferase [Rhizobacter sp.]
MDMLIKLYALPAQPQQPLPQGVTVRKPIGPEHDLLTAWIVRQFGAGWASEARAAMSNHPTSLYIATQSNTPIGFACYDATARGLFGPIGVSPEARGSGVGAALLLACLHEMRSLGYAYAVAGYVGSTEFFRRVARATEIEGSEPGLYQGMLRQP